MTKCAENIIANFEVLKDFKIQSVISVFIPACVAFALLYQSEEQKNAAVKDHAIFRFFSYNYNLFPSQNTQRIRK